MIQSLIRKRSKKYFEQLFKRQEINFSDAIIYAKPDK